ncbi:MAG: hypothetical protein Q7U54_19210 [Bacteroidales bacterium]|nr:hypothetical protein [Bacteroidales bacterium]
MEKRDYLIDQIEQLGQALAQIFSKLFRQSNQGKVPEAIEMTSRSLKTELDLDLAEISSIPPGDFIITLQKVKKLNHTNLELLADILLQVADATFIDDLKSDESFNLYSKCLEIYNHLNERDLTYSFERESKIARIQNILLQTN